jgi:hypothetical protein
MAAGLNGMSKLQIACTLRYSGKVDRASHFMQSGGKVAVTRLIISILQVSHLAQTSRH